MLDCTAALSLNQESLLQIFLFISLCYNSLATVYDKDSAAVNALHLLSEDIVNRLEVRVVHRYMGDASWTAQM